jgi:Tfp pilus assembly protein PilO
MGRFIPIILIVASVGAFFGFVDPRYEGIKVLRAESAQYGNALDNARKLQEIRDSLRSTYNTIPTKDLDRLKKLLPDHVDNVRLIIDISDIARQYGLTLRSVKNVDAAVVAKERETFDLEESPIGSVTLNFSVDAAYNNFVAFLKDLEASLRIVDITSLSFEVRDVSTYTFDVGIKTYWLK